MTSNLHLATVSAFNYESSQTDVGRLGYSSDALSGSCTFNIEIADHLKLPHDADTSGYLRIHTQGTICGIHVSADTLIDESWPN